LAQKIHESTIMAPRTAAGFQRQEGQWLKSIHNLKTKYPVDLLDGIIIGFQRQIVAPVKPTHFAHGHAQVQALLGMGTLQLTIKDETSG
jgi:hypothetical protein